jgi:cell division protein FtsZ
MDTNKPIHILVLGIGGGGCNAVQHLARYTCENVRIAALNTDSQALESCSVETKLVLGLKSMRGLGAGGDPNQGRFAAEEDSEKIAALCQGANLVFIVAGLGGGTGTGASPVVAKIAKDKGALVLGIGFKPFEFEGGKRLRIAAQGCEELRRVADGCISLPNQSVLKMIDEKTPALEAFRIINELVAEGVMGIYRLLGRTGLINVDFADLCGVLQARHSTGLIASIEAKGENRAREIWERVLAHPQMDGGQALAEAEGLLVGITGGPDLTMAEINRIMEPIHRQAEHAHIIMGAAIEEEWRERVSLTLVASLGEGRELHTVEARARVAMYAGSVKESGVSVEGVGSPFGGEGDRVSSRYVAPAPALTPERADHLLSQQSGSRGRKAGGRMRQGQLPLEIVSKGRFEKSEPTIHQGEDLDVPTYIRRGVALN